MVTHSWKLRSWRLQMTDIQTAAGAGSFFYLISLLSLLQYNVAKILSFSENNHYVLLFMLNNVSVS